MSALFTTQWYEAREAKRSAKLTPTSPDAVDDETALHNSIIKELRSRRWLYFHGKMSARTRRTLGEPDFTILAPQRVIFVECKSKSGKRSPDQQTVAYCARLLGHEIHLVSSMREFLEKIDQT